ncbi:coiled-coil domain-containing protein 138 isoform X4 [Cuculus canorus]|uniref:coiled-coil domain-containing protein 138 isoform X4 n=1 Tax=Cuculus canorus TaxID=55661 RepID=UPI0023AAE1B6|nr:coiled-coil domain-containing protein 138 isoform X4 [Cuculus canorus]
MAGAGPGRGRAGDCLSEAIQTDYKSGGSLVYRGHMDISLENTTVSLSKCSSESEFTESGRENSIRSSGGFLQNFQDWDCFDDAQDSFSDSSGLEIEEKAINYFETGSTLPSHLAANARENGDQSIISGLIRKIMSGTDAQACSSKGFIPPHINQIYDELSVIHQKLQQHEAEVKQLTEALREITKENRRLKLSFDTLKEMNDSLRKQLNDVTELNKKLEGQARKVQARLENLQRKHEFLIVRKSKDVCQVVQQSKPVKQEKATVTSKIAKLPLNSQVYELLTFLMDWISDQHLSKIKIQEEREGSRKFTVAQTTKKPCTQERCMKLLPMAAEQLQWMPFVNPKLHMPVIKFIYWSIRQLDTGVQHAIMTSTMRRLGEDIFKGIVSKGNPHSPSEQSTQSKSKSAAFFKSSCMPLRFLSTLIVLKTVTQVDYLAKAFDSLCVDLKTDEGKALFLEYQCVPVILRHLKVSSRGLLSSALDGLLQMTMESGSLQPFLEACSNESFFRTCSALLRSSKLDIQILEKLCVLLQNLSRIKSNMKMFELFNLHQTIQELHRTANPDHAFLCINLNSILLNLGLSRSSSLTSSLSTSH